MPLLVREIGEVDGASVEEWQLVERFPDPRLDALETVEQIAQAADGRRPRDPPGERCPQRVRRRLERRHPRRRRRSRAIGEGIPAPSVLDVLGDRHHRVAHGRGRRGRARRPRDRAARQAQRDAARRARRPSVPPARTAAAARARAHRRSRRRADRLTDRVVALVELPLRRGSRCGPRGGARRASSSCVEPQVVLEPLGVEVAALRPRRCTAHPGSLSCAQSRNRHCAASASMSANARLKPSSESQSDTARNPGVSMSTPPFGSSDELARGRRVAAALVTRRGRRRWPARRCRPAG